MKPESQYYALYDGSLLVSVAYSPSGLFPSIKKDIIPKPVDESEFFRLGEKILKWLGYY
jgi:hypothetical protein